MTPFLFIFSKSLSCLFPSRGSLGFTILSYLRSISYLQSFPIPDPFPSISYSSISCFLLHPFILSLVLSCTLPGIVSWMLGYVLLEQYFPFSTSFRLFCSTDLYLTLQRPIWTLYFTFNSLIFLGNATPRVSRSCIQSAV